MDLSLLNYPRYRKGIQPAKTSASKLLGMAVNISGWDIAQSSLWAVTTCLHEKEGMKNSGLSHEDMQDKNN